MIGQEDPRLADVLAAVVRRGSATVAEIGADIGCEDADEVFQLLEVLVDWASIEQVETKADQEHAIETAELSYRTLARDTQGRTIYDVANHVGEPGSSCAGDVSLVSDPAALLEQERSHTYLGCGFWKRAGMLVAGPLVNILCGILAIVLITSVLGIETVVADSVVGEVQAGSLAEEAGLVAGDVIVEVAGETVQTWYDLRLVLSDVLETGESFGLVWERDGVELSATIYPGADDTQLGIVQATQTIRIGIIDSLAIAFSYIAQLVSFIAQLFVPTRTAEILDQSTSIVGIAYMSQQAAAAGLSEFLNIIASISMSLALMNLLPIPPLDGGKLLLELIEAIRKKPVSVRVANGLSIVGVVFFLIIFVWVLRGDIIRFVLA